MKKILFSAYSLEVGGIEKALVTLLNELCNSYDITLVLEKKSGVLLKELNKNIKIVEYSPSYNKVKLISKTINAIKRTMFLLKYKNKFSASFSYATYCRMGSMVAQAASENCNLWVHSSYLSIFNNDEKKYKDFFNELNADKFNNIIFVSNRSKNEFNSIMNKNNGIVCRNLIDYKNIINLSQEKINLYKDDSKFTFLYIGRLTEDSKRVSRLIEAVSILKDEFSNFRVIVIGNGKNAEDYKKMCDKHNIKKYFTFLGEVSNPYPYFKISDSLILVSEDEGYPVVYDEAKVMNLPIITTDVSDSKIDIENKYGYVCEKNANSIASYMKEMIKNKFIINENIDFQQYNDESISIIKDIIEK